METHRDSYARDRGENVYRVTYPDSSVGILRADHQVSAARKAVACRRPKGPLLIQLFEDGDPIDFWHFDSDGQVIVARH